MRSLAGMAVGAALVLLAAILVIPRLSSDETGNEPGTLYVLSGRDESEGLQRQALIDQWNALGNPRAEIISLEGGADAYRAQMVACAQSRCGVDIFNLDVTWTAEFAEHGYLRSFLSDTTGFLAKPLDTCWHNGKLWALPFNTDAGLLYYRTDLVTSAPPTSWPGIRNTIDEVFAKRGKEFPDLVAGYAGQLDNYEGLTVNALEAIWAAEGEVVTGGGRVVVDTPEAREGLRRLVTGLAPGNPQHILPQSREFDEGRTTAAFRDGKVIFMRNWPVAFRQLSNSVPFATAPLPRASVLGGQNLAIAADSDQPRAAQRLIEFLTSERSQQILFERGGFAATRGIVYEDGQVRQKYPYARTLLDAVRAARLRPVTPHYSRFSAEFRSGVLFSLANGGDLPPDFNQRLTAALSGHLP